MSSKSRQARVRVLGSYGPIYQHLTFPQQGSFEGSMLGTSTQSGKGCKMREAEGT